MDRLKGVRTKRAGTPQDVQAALGMSSMTWIWSSPSNADMPSTDTSGRPTTIWFIATGSVSTWSGRFGLKVIRPRWQPQLQSRGTLCHPQIRRTTLARSNEENWSFGLQSGLDSPITRTEEEIFTTRRFRSNSSCIRPLKVTFLFEGVLDEVECSD